ncbi:MAG: KpsF/GutQ family sugar-phosphate isomerase [Alphaproteobacteria bacterium]|nr:KpsF/GutQ family sugar-phosphate isomerase [Alphaproteobacteria bacterium]
MTKHIEIASEVIDLEILGLRALKNALDQGFSDAVEVLRRADGRVVVSGMGKSGHVARKIAATFSSTGSPAIFVHPGEASHGDLGMISGQDVILALSKSGETSELGDLLAYAARFSIPIVAITCQSGSTLAKAATAALILPPAKEACGETRAPTTSTTMMMAAGDALAIALLRDRGFTADDFQGFHPGGNLGAALRRASDLMHGADRLPLATASTPMMDLVKIISAGGFGCAGIVDAEEALVGIITDGDLRRHYGGDISNLTAGDIMTEHPRTAPPEALAGDVLALMSREKITALFVVKDKRPVGIIHVHDCLSTGVL